MRPPPDEKKQGRNGELSAKLASFRPYLHMLARLQFDETLQTKLDESDIVQQTLLEAHRSAGTFRGKTDEEMAGWLRTILARNIADELRKFRRGKRDIRLEASLQASMNQSSVRIERWLATEDVSPSQHAIANEQLIALATALMKLPEDQRQAIELVHLQGHSSADVARRLDRSEVAVAGLLRRGLQRLREVFRQEQ